MAQYWLLDWLDYEGLGDAEVAYGVLRTKSGLARFCAAAERAMGQDLIPPREPASMVAGGSLALAGIRSCNSAACRINTVDQLVMNTWHYFQRVVVTGLDPRRVLAYAEALDMDTDMMAYYFRSDLDVALYVREIEAEDILFFQRPGQYCLEHLDVHAQQAGLAPAGPTAAQLRAELGAGYSLEVAEQDGGTFYVFPHPALDYVATGVVEDGEDVERLAASLVDQAARGHVAELIGTASLARASHAALGQFTSVHSPVLTSGNSGSPAPGDVAFNLSLPTMPELTARDILALRREEGEEFAVFRGALHKVIEERIAALPGEDPIGIAQSIDHDVLQPAIAKFRRRMSLSRTLLGRRSEIAMLSGGLLTTVGFMAFAPVVVPGMVLAAGGVAGGLSDYLKEKRDFRESDIHFLWRVSDDAAGRHR